VNGGLPNNPFPAPLPEEREETWHTVHEFKERKIHSEKSLPSDGRGARREFGSSELKLAVGRIGSKQLEAYRDAFGGLKR